MVKLLFDTNILLDLCNANRAPFHQDCPDLLARSVAVDVPCGYTG